MALGMSVGPVDVNNPLGLIGLLINGTVLFVLLVPDARRILGMVDS